MSFGTEPFRSRSNSIPGANWPRSEKAVNHELLMDSEESAVLVPNSGLGLMREAVGVALVVV